MLKYPSCYWNIHGMLIYRWSIIKSDVSNVCLHVLNWVFNFFFLGMLIFHLPKVLTVLHFFVVSILLFKFKKLFSCMFIIKPWLIGYMLPHLDCIRNHHKQEQYIFLSFVFISFSLESAVVTYMSLYCSNLWWMCFILL